MILPFSQPIYLILLTVISSSILYQSLGDIYSVDLDTVQIQIPRRTSDLLISLYEIPLPFNIELSGIVYSPDNTTILPGSSINSLCWLMPHQFGNVNSWFYEDNYLQITKILKLNTSVLGINATNNTIVVFSMKPMPDGTSQILGKINVDPRLLLNSSYPITADMRNNAIFFVQNNSLYVFGVPSKINQTNNYWNASSKVLTFIGHNQTNFIKAIGKYLFVGSELGLDAYNISNFVYTTSNITYSIPVIKQFYGFLGVIDVDMDSQENVYVLTNNSKVVIYNMGNLSATQNSFLLVNNGAKYIKKQPGTIIILGQNQTWFLEDYLIPTQILPLPSQLTLNRFLDFNLTNIQSFSWDNQFLYIILNGTVFVMQSGIPVNYAQNYTSFTTNLTFPLINQSMSVIAVPSSNSLSSLIILSNQSISQEILIMQDSFLECNPADNAPDGNYNMLIEAYIENCTAKTAAKDVNPNNVCLLKQVYDVNLYTYTAPDNSNTKKALIIGLSVGLTIALLLGIGCFIRIRKFNKKYQDLENKYKNVKFTQLEGGQDNNQEQGHHNAHSLDKQNKQYSPTDKANQTDVSKIANTSRFELVKDQGKSGMIGNKDIELNLEENPNNMD